MYNVRLIPSLHNQIFHAHWFYWMHDYNWQSHNFIDALASLILNVLRFVISADASGCHSQTDDSIGVRWRLTLTTINAGTRLTSRALIIHRRTAIKTPLRSRSHALVKMSSIYVDILRSYNFTRCQIGCVKWFSEYNNASWRWLNPFYLVV